MAGKQARKQKRAFPIRHWSYSSLMAYLRNPLAWYKRYVEEVYDTPSSPSSIVGRAGHTALQHFYGGISKDGAIELGLEYLRAVPDFEINFGKVTTKTGKKKKREQMEREYLQAIGFYLEKPPRYKVLAVEFKALAEVEGIALPLKAVSDLIVKSRLDKDAIDIVEHKFVDSFSPAGSEKSLFMFQAIFNYYTVKYAMGREVRRFIVHECKKKKNADGSSQMRRYAIDFGTCAEEFDLFRRLVNDATADIGRRRVYLPNPMDIFEGENSLAIYRMGLTLGEDVEGEGPQRMGDIESY